MAIARAFITQPSILLADEPTGNLDTRTSVEVMGIFQRLNVERGITVLVDHPRNGHRGIRHAHHHSAGTDMIVSDERASPSAASPMTSCERFRSEETVA